MQDILQQKLGAKIAYSGAAASTGSGLWGWMADNHQALASVGVLVGIVVALTGLAIQIRSARRAEKRAEEAHQRRMEAIREEK